eukprot:SAG11_NODE_3932_length_2143_cov_2.221624_2_plen_87_part_00
MRFEKARHEKELHPLVADQSYGAHRQLGGTPLGADRRRAAFYVSVGFLACTGILGTAACLCEPFPISHNTGAVIYCALGLHLQSDN